MDKAQVKVRTVRICSHDGHNAVYGVIVNAESANTTKLICCSPTTTSDQAEADEWASSLMQTAQRMKETYVSTP